MRFRILAPVLAAGFAVLAGSAAEADYRQSSRGYGYGYGYSYGYTAQGCPCPAPVATRRVYGYVAAPAVRAPRVYGYVAPGGYAAPPAVLPYAAPGYAITGIPGVNSQVPLRPRYSTRRDGTPSDYRFGAGAYANDNEIRLFYRRINDYSGG